MATTFQAGEVDALLAVANTLQRGGDPGTLIRSDEWRAVVAKFVRMQRKARGVETIPKSAPDPTPTRWYK